MTPANPDALVAALAHELARVSELEAENAQLTVERNEALAMRRWNIDRTGDGEVLVCRGHHDKGEDCDNERFVPEERLAAAEARAAQLQAEVEAKDRRIAELSETWTDEAGTVWSPPTAWAYAKACAALRKHREEGEALRAALTDTEQTLRELVRDVASLDWMQEQEAEGLGPLAAARTALAARAATAREG